MFNPVYYIELAWRENKGLEKQQSQTASRGLGWGFFYFRAEILNDTLYLSFFL